MPTPTVAPLTRSSRGVILFGILGVIATVVAVLSPALSGPEARPIPALERRQKGESEYHPIEKRLNTCMEKAGSTAAMVACVDKAQKEWDAELNSVYQRLQKILPAKGQAELKESQRAWIAFRDREIKVLRTFYTGRQGTMYIPMATDSVMQITKDRALQIDHLLDIYAIEKNGP